MPAGLRLYLPSQAARITTGEIGTPARDCPAQRPVPALPGWRRCGHGCGCGSV